MADDSGKLPNPTLPDHEDQELQMLFDRGLRAEALPPAVLDRVVLQVLDEVQHSGLRPPAAPAPSYLERFRNWLGRLRPTQSLALAGVGALAVMLLFALVSRLTPRAVSAVAEVMGGDATVLRAHNDSYRVYRDGDVLKVGQGDQILTRDGSVRLTAFPNQTAVIEPGSNVTIAQLDEANGATQVALAVSDGTVRSSIAEHLQSDDSYVINAPGVNVSAYGTEFSVEAVSQEETLVTAYTGAVTVEMGQQKVQIGPGQEVDAVVGKALAVDVADGKYDGGNAPYLVAVDAGQGLQVLSLPQPAAAVLGKLLAGESLKIVDRQDTQTAGQWVQVCCIAGQPGWVSLSPIQR